MSEIGLHHGLAGLGVGLSVGLGVRGNTTNGRQDKSADRCRAHVVGWVGLFGHWTNRSSWRLRRKVQGIQRSERHRPPFGGLWLP